ncbi:MAG: hypothetical protein LBG43_06320 [Treponema sp.]|jgi:hypothetical protein|nr:hypothetical protein [Treponema sp.]
MEWSENLIAASLTGRNLPQAKPEKMARLVKLEEAFVRNNLQNNGAMTNNGRDAIKISILRPHARIVYGAANRA